MRQNDIQFSSYGKSYEVSASWEYWAWFEEHLDCYWASELDALLIFFIWYNIGLLYDATLAESLFLIFWVSNRAHKFIYSNFNLWVIVRGCLWKLRHLILIDLILRVLNCVPHLFSNVTLITALALAVIFPLLDIGLNPWLLLISFHQFSWNSLRVHICYRLLWLTGGVHILSGLVWRLCLIDIGGWIFELVILLHDDWLLSNTVNISTWLMNF